MVQEKLADPESASVTIRASNSSNDHIAGHSEKSPLDERLKGGGLSAWATVLSTFLIEITGFGYATTFGVFQDFYVREFLTRSTSSQISWIGSTQAFLMLTMGLFAGRLFDRGYCYHLVITGSIILVLSLFMLSLAQPEHYYQVFITQGLGVGIGAGLAYTPAIAVLAQHFPDPSARAHAMGVGVSGVSIGGLAHPIFLNSLLHKQDGRGSEEAQKAFAFATRSSAGLITGLTIIAVLLLRTKYPKADETDSTDSTEESGEKDITDRKRPTELKTTVVKFATDWPYVCFVIGMVFIELVFFFPLFYIQLYAIQHGLDPNFAFYSLSILNGASFIGRLIPGFFTRRLGVANILLFATAVSTILLFCMLGVHTVAGLAIFVSLYGFFTGAFITLTNPMLVLLADSPGEIGARMGMCFATMGFGSLIGTPIAGALLTSRFIWWRPIVFSGVVCVGACLLFTACRVMLGKRKGSFWII